MQLNKKQYHTLLTALQVADYVYGIMGDAVDNKYKKKNRQIEDLISIVLENADKYNMGEFVENFEGEKCLNEKFMDKVIPDLMEFEDYNFWDLLVREMAKKELFSKYTEAELKKMDGKEYFFNVLALEEKYDEIFNKKGIDCLELVDRDK
jgi:hypothetical protein